MVMRCNVPCELHNMLNHHHKSNEEGIHQVKGDILKLECGKPGLGLSHSNWQHLTDCIVPKEH